MNTNIESLLIRRLKEFLQNEDIKVGDRLPSERKMAEILGSSRNSVRNAIKMIQAKGILEVRASSGYYLKTKTNLEDLLSDTDTVHEMALMTNQLEAFYIIEPQVVRLAAARITDDEIKVLEDCLVNLSKAMLENDFCEIGINHKAFHEIIASSTGNRAIMTMMEQLKLAYKLVSDIFQKSSQEERDKVFALHVNLFTALTAHDKEKAYDLSQEMVLSISNLLNRFERVDLPDIVREEIEKRNS